MCLGDVGVSVPGEPARVLAGGLLSHGAAEQSEMASPRAPSLVAVDGGDSESWGASSLQGIVSGLGRGLSAVPGPSGLFLQHRLNSPIVSVPGTHKAPQSRVQAEGLFN